MRKILVIVIVALIIVTTCTALEQPPCYKNVKPPSWYLEMVKNQNQGGHAVQLQNTGFVMPDLGGLKSLQSRHG